jgi:cytochrome c oxidase assembly protein subunit 15
LTDQIGAEEKATSRGLYWLAILVACLTLVLLMAGALVTSNEAGDSVPDWPLSFGRWLIHSEYFVANVRYEYSHRVIAGVVGFTTFILAVWAWKTESRRWVRRLAFVAFAGVVAQALIGGVRVLFPEYKALIAVPHALVAQSFFGLIIGLAVFTSRGWLRNSDRAIDAGRPGLRSLATASVGAVLIQLVLGAGFRHQAFGIIPHLVGALVVTLLIVWTASRAMSGHESGTYLRRPAIVAPVLLVLQVALGIAAYVARMKSAGEPQPLEPMISLTVAHVVVGALTLATMIVLMLRSHRVLMPKAERVAEKAGAKRLDSTAQGAAV